MLIAYLPKKRILFTADFNPPRPGQPVNPSHGGARREHRPPGAGRRPPRNRARAVSGPPLTGTDLAEWVKGAR